MAPSRNSWWTTDPWPYFLSFLAANVLISYFDLPVGWAAMVGLLGIALPFVGGFLQRQGPFAKDPSPSEEFLGPIPPWAWVLLGAGAVFGRFTQLTTLSVWPNYDDGLWGFFALDFIHHWDWNPFYQDNSYPSTYAWGLAVLFKCFGPSLALVWAYPALISLAVVPMGYAAARLFLSRSLSFFIALFLGLGFWPLFVGRFGNQQVLTLLWECVWLVAWALYEGKGPGRGRPLAAGLVLGAVTALGFYIYISWVAIAGFTGLTLAVQAWRAKRRNWGREAAFVLSFLLVLTPLLFGGLIHNYGRIVHDIGSFRSTVTLNDRLGTAWGYLEALFWRMPPGRFSYQPVWGGLLDPLLAGLFFLGLGGLLRRWKDPWNLWVLGALAFFFVPGILTHDVEPFRNLPLIPFLALTCGQGIHSLLASRPSSHRLVGLAIFVLAFAGLDLYHLTVRYHRVWDQVATWKGYAKPMERYRAFQLLEPIARSQGPGLVFSNFAPGLPDQTLSVADHSFNAVENPDLPFDRASWAALLVNANYRPFLKDRFPQGRAYYLSKDMDSADGGQMLWVMPVRETDRRVLAGWKKASDAFRSFPGRYNTILRSGLAAAYPSFQGDPLLESLYAEKLSDLDFRSGDFKDTGKPAADLESGLRQGYPAAHLYQKLGVLRLLRGDRTGARDAFRRATKAPLDLTQAARDLKSLDAPTVEKNAAP